MMGQRGVFKRFLRRECQQGQPHGPYMKFICSPDAAETIHQCWGSMVILEHVGCISEGPAARPAVCNSQTGEAAVAACDWTAVIHSKRIARLHHYHTDYFPRGYRSIQFAFLRRRDSASGSGLTVAAGSET